jgi:subtilase-type serine protease
MHSPRFVRRSDRPQLAERTTILPRRRRTALLAGTAFTGAFIAAMAGNPQSALAVCAGENGPLVTCELATPATAGKLSTSFNGTTVVNVNPGGKIDTGGATASVAAPGGSLTFNNNDTTFGITSVGAFHGVNLINNFGAITYVGNANVTSTQIATSGINAFASVAGDISITNNATVVGSFDGIAVAHLGTGGVLVTGTGAATGGSDAGISVQYLGLGPAAGTNGIAISGSGNATSTGDTGISAFINNAANASNILIDRSGTVSGGALGIFAVTTGTGNVTVTGGSLVTSTASHGIQATQLGNIAGTNASVTVGGSGNVNATGGNGIDATVPHRHGDGDSRRHFRGGGRRR